MTTSPNLTFMKNTQNVYLELPWEHRTVYFVQLTRVLMKVSVLKWFYCVHPYYKNYDIMILD